MADQSSWEWFYSTIILGHEGPLMLVVILTVLGFSFMAWKGIIGFPQLSRSNEREKNTERVGTAFMEKMNEKFMSRVDCKTHQEDCSEVIANTLVGLNKSIADIKEGVDRLRNEKTQETKELAYFMGQVDSYMKGH